MIRTILKSFSPLVPTFTHSSFCNKKLISNNTAYYLFNNNKTFINFRPLIAITKQLLHITMTHTSSSAISENDHDKVFVQFDPKKDSLNICFNFTYDGKSKQFNLSRKASDSLLSSLERIKFNLIKLSKPKKHESAEDAIRMNNFSDVCLTLNDSPVDTAIKNVDAWVDKAILNINGRLYEVTTNSPQVNSIKLPACIMKNFVTMPSIKLVNCTIDNCKLQWFRQITTKEKNQMISQQPNLESKLTFDGNCFYYKISDSLVHNPTEDDVGHHLRFSCRPSDGNKQGPEFHCISSKPVELGPPRCPFEERHKLTRERINAPNKFRFVTYNILADLYADSDYSRTVLFGHCPSHALDIDYRRQLLLKELFGYNADIYCMQEVDKKEFEKTFEPFFRVINNCSGIYDSKGGQVGEGEAIFYRNDRFELIDSHKTLLSELIEEKKVITGSTDAETTDKCKTEDGIQADDNSRQSVEHFILKQRESTEAQKCLQKFDEIRKAILSKEQLRSRFCDRHTILQTTLLKLKESTQNQYIMVANTHLYFAPDADHVRLLQGSVCVKYIEFIKEYYQQRLKNDNGDQDEPRISVIFCGDMNSSPDCGLYKLLTKGSVDGQLPDWSSSGDNELVPDLNISTLLKFSSAYENIPYTNYTQEFNGCLDYIYYERDNIDCEQTIPLPDHNDVTAIGGLPSDVFPSDHLALIADLKVSA